MAVKKTSMREEIQQALSVLREGGIILYPTDTVWGIGCDASNPEAVKKVYDLKNRADSKALITISCFRSNARKNCNRYARYSLGFNRCC